MPVIGGTQMSSDEMVAACDGRSYLAIMMRAVYAIDERRRRMGQKLVHVCHLLKILARFATQAQV